MKKLLNLSFVLLLLLSCDTDNLLTSLKMTDTVQIELNIKSEEIKRLEEISAQFKLKNISDKKVVYGFPSGCQYGYTVTKNNSTIFDSRKKLFCTAAFTQLKLEPGQTKSFPISLDRFDINEKLDKGVYKLQAFLLQDHTPKISASFKVK